MRNSLLRLMALLFAFSMIAAACGSDDEEDTTDETTETTAAAEEEAEDVDEAPADDAMEEEDDAMEEGEEAMASVSLAEVCPSPVIFQLDWNPEAEHGAMYEMVGDDYSIDSDNFIVSGSLVSGEEDTGVDVEIRTGGPAIGFQQVTAQLYQDTDIHFGYISTDEAIENFNDLPTISFVAPLEKNPQIIMWDPDTYPEAETIADLPDDTIVRYFGGASYIPFLLDQGIVVDGQLDDTYDGTPAVFVAEGGAIAQQGFASAEPFIYQNEVPEWGKPVNYQLIHDTGFEIYAAAIGARAGDFEELTPCIEAIAPVIQQAQVDYVNDPAATNELIIEAVEAYDNGWVYSAAVADFSVEAQLSDGLVSNGPDSTLGNFDLDRIQSVIDILGAEGITPEDLVTNEFIDESIGL